MNTKIFKVILISLTLCFAGCITTDHEKTEQDQRVGIAEQKSEISQKELDEIKSHASPLAYGVGEALNKEENASLSVQIAKQLNDRVKILLGNPSYEDMIEAGQMVKNLTSAIEKDRRAGEKVLKEKDKEIFKTNQELEKLRQEYDQLEKDYKATAEKSAKEADEYGVVVKKVNSWFGLGGIVYGVKRLAYWILGFGILFLVLRFAAFFSPIASAIFGVFEGIFAAFIKALAWLVPGAFKLAGWVGHGIFSSLQESHEHIIDKIQEMKLDQEKNPGKVYTLDDILDVFAKSMNDSEKKQVEEALKTLKWKE